MYKGFREQFIECKDSNVLVEETCPICGQVLLMCAKYGGQCKSNKCREERIIEED